MNTPSTSSAAAAGPSRTTTVTASAPAEDVGILRLRPEPRRHTSSRRVVWTDETVDNEGLGRKKSKICCIYHKPKAFDESSDESCSGSSSGASDSETSDEDSDDARSDGPIVSKALKDKLQRQRGHGEHDGHEHCSAGKGKAKKRPQKTRNSAGTQTTTVSEDPAEKEHGGRADSDDEDAGNGFRPNAYERGTR